MDVLESTPLHLACENGNVEEIKLLLDEGADISIVDNFGYTPFHRACGGNNLEIIKLLLERGADISNKSKYGHTPLYNACSSGSIEVIRLLIDNGAKVLIIDDFGFTPLHYSCSSGNVEAVKILFEKDVKGSMYCITKANYKFGHTPLHCACDSSNGIKRSFQQQFEIIKILIEIGGDISVIDGGGSTPIELLKDVNKKTVEEYISTLNVEIKPAK